MQNFRVFGKSGKISDFSEKTFLCRMTQFMQFCKKNFFFLQIFQSGKFSTKVEKSPILSIGDEIWQTRRSRCRKQNFTKVEIFPPKVENFRPLQNVPIHAILQKNFFFCRFLEVENYPLKWKIFQFLHLDWIWARLEVQKSEKIFTKVEVFPIKMENFPPLQNVPIHVILE